MQKEIDQMTKVMFRYCCCVSNTAEKIITQIILIAKWIVVVQYDAAVYCGDPLCNNPMQ